MCQKAVLWIRTTLIDADPDADPDSTYHRDPDPESDYYLMRIRIRIRNFFYFADAGPYPTIKAQTLEKVLKYSIYFGLSSAN
jgi:hypothetical protein